MAESLILYNDKAKHRYELAKIPEVANGLSAVERLVFKAQFGRPFSDYQQAELVRALAEPVRFVMMDVGAKAGDAGENAYRLARTAELLKRYFGELTLADFRQAFELLISGELDAYLPKRDGKPDRGHYQNFNAEYIIKVFRAYALRRAAVMRRAEELKPKEAPARDLEAEARSWKVVRDGFYHDWLYYKYHGRMPRISPVAVVIYYNAFSRLGWVDELPVDAKEQESVIYSAFVGLTGKPVTESHRTQWKRREIERAFRDMVEDEIQFDKFI